MISSFQSFILGMVQGITEFLPISSSAHLILFPWIFGWKDPGLAFDAFLHLGTLAAVFLYFIRDWWMLTKAGILSIIERKIGFEAERILFWWIVIGSIPAGLVGWVMKDSAETLGRSPLLIAIFLSSLGFLLYWVDGHYPSTRKMDDLRFKDAFYIGLAQVAALFPGVSRSGSTMTMGRFLGLSREAAARYSFLLAFPITLAAGVFKGREVFMNPVLEVPMNQLLIGLGSSAFFGLISIHGLLRFLRFADFGIFAWYRVALAAFIVVWSIFTGT